MPIGETRSSGRRPTPYSRDTGRVGLASPRRSALRTMFCGRGRWIRRRDGGGGVGPILGGGTGDRSRAFGVRERAADRARVSGCRQWLLGGGGRRASPRSRTLCLRKARQSPAGPVVRAVRGAGPPAEPLAAPAWRRPSPWGHPRGRVSSARTAPRSAPPDSQDSGWMRSPGETPRRRGRGRDGR